MTHEQVNQDLRERAEAIFKTCPTLIQQHVGTFYDSEHAIKLCIQFASEVAGEKDVKIAERDLRVAELELELKAIKVQRQHDMQLAKMATKRIAEFEAANKWIRFEDKKPEPNQFILIRWPSDKSDPETRRLTESDLHQDWSEMQWLPIPLEN